MTAVLVLIGYGWTITSDSLGHMLSSTLGGAGLLAVYGIKVLIMFLSFVGVIDSVDHAMYHDYENRGGQLVALLQFGAPCHTPRTIAGVSAPFVPAPTPAGWACRLLGGSHSTACPCLF